MFGVRSAAVSVNICCNYFSYGHFGAWSATRDIMDSVSGDSRDMKTRRRIARLRSMAGLSRSAGQLQ
jgi:hypothetical protein